MPPVQFQFLPLTIQTKHNSLLVYVFGFNVNRYERLFKTVTRSSEQNYVKLKLLFDVCVTVHF